MRCIDHDGIDSRLHKSRHALFRAFAHAHSRAYAQLALLIARSIRKAGLLGDVFDRDEALQAELIVHHEQALQAMFIEQRFGFLEWRAHGHRN